DKEEADGEEEKEELMGNGTSSSADRRRHIWRLTSRATDEREGQNETSFEFTTIDNGPLSVDLYSTPHYKMDQSTLDPDVAEKKPGCVYEVSLPSEEGTEGEKKVEGEEGEAEEGEDEEGPPSAVVTVFRFIMKQSYICALIAMMAWSITYVSWLTLVFLIWSCVLWMVRDRRRYAMLTSPFMVAYGNLLIVLQYIYSFEILDTVPGFFLKPTVPFSELGSKTFRIEFPTPNKRLIDEK
ncbi:hypothetical protein CRUP_035754, partial [Coryphaenoides rupestris]